MYIYLLEVYGYSGKRKVIPNHEHTFYTKLFLNNNINDVIHHAIEYVKMANKNLLYEGIDKLDGGFSVFTYLHNNPDQQPSNVFETFLSKSEYYVQHYDLNGEEYYGEFMSSDKFIPPEFIPSWFFDINHSYKFKVGDIVYYDGCSCGEYVITHIPEPITEYTKYNYQKHSYHIKGFSPECDNQDVYVTEGVDEFAIKHLNDTDVHDPRIFILRDFILHKRSDIDNIEDECLKDLIMYAPDDEV